VKLLITQIQQNVKYFLDVLVVFFLSTIIRQLQLSEYIMWHFKEYEEDEDVSMSAAGVIFLAI